MTVTTELVSLAILVIGFVTTAWVRVETIVNRARAEAMTAAAAAGARAEVLQAVLHEHKLHVAETYVSKVGLREQMERIIGAIEGVGGQVSHLNERIDRVIEGQPSPRRPPKSAA
jgi:hypothetical protein